MSSGGGIPDLTVEEKLSLAAGHPESCSCALHADVRANSKRLVGYQLCLKPLWYPFRRILRIR